MSKKWLYSLMTFRMFLYSLVTTVAALIAALHLQPLSTMTHDQKIILALSLFSIQAGVVLAFIDKSLATLQAAPKDISPPKASSPITTQT